MCPGKERSMKTKTLRNWLSIGALVIGSCLAGRTLFSQEEGIKSHLIARPAARVELRAESSRLSLISSTGEKLTNCRPYVAWRYAGESKWHEDYAKKFASLRTRKGRTSFDFEAGPLRISVVAERQGTDTWKFWGQVTNRGDRPVELARFHYLHGTVDKRYSLLNSDFGVLRKHGEHQPPERQFQEQFWASMGVHWPRLSEPIHDAPDWGVSTDVGLLLTAWNEPGWICGCVGPGTAWGEVGLQTMPEEPSFFVGTLLDNILLDPGETRGLEQAIVRYGDLQDGYRFWAEQSVQSMTPKPRVPKAPLVGYCSWYQQGSDVTGEEIVKATKEFAEWSVTPGGRTIQIDDGFQKMPADWSPNKRFASIWKDLPQRMKETGSIPGIWLAPTAALDTSSLFKEHPDWFQRLPSESRPAVSFSNWKWCGGDQTYFLEYDRPEVKEFMRNLFRDLVGQGWGYIKIDFTYALSTARAAYDRKKTQFQTLRDTYALFREASGPTVLLNACVGGTLRYTLGYVDFCRIGDDIPDAWDGMRKVYRALFPRFGVNGIWWIGDPDVYYLRNNVQLNLEARYLQVGTIGLVGGLFLTSDFPSQWSPEAKEILKEFWNNQGGLRVPSDQYAAYAPDGLPTAYRASYATGPGPQHQVGVYNWANEPQTIRVALKDIGLKSGIRWRLTASPNHSPSARLDGEYLVVENQPPHSLRIAGLTAE
jgi:alpha-galactosidase